MPLQLISIIKFFIQIFLREKEVLILLNYVRWVINHLPHFERLEELNKFGFLCLFDWCWFHSLKLSFSIIIWSFRFLVFLSTAFLRISSHISKWPSLPAKWSGDFPFIGSVLLSVFWSFPSKKQKLIPRFYQRWPKVSNESMLNMPRRLML